MMSAVHRSFFLSRSSPILIQFTSVDLKLKGLAVIFCGPVAKYAAAGPVLSPGHDDDLVEWWLRVRKAVVKERRRGFDSLVCLVVWQLWLERNARTFNRRAAQVPAMLVKVWSEVKMWCLAKIITWSQLIPG